MNKIELQTFHGGALVELFGEQMRKVLENIEDENTAPNSERSVTLRITIRPDKLRRAGEVKIHADCKLAKVKPAETFVFFDRDDEGAFSAYEDDPGPELPGISEASGNVVTFKKSGTGG